MCDLGIVQYRGENQYNNLFTVPLCAMSNGMTKKIPHLQIIDHQMIYRGKDTRTKTIKDKQIKARKQSAKKSVNQPSLSSIERLLPKISEDLQNKDYT